MTHAYAATTNDVCVVVRAFYLEDQSRPNDGKFVWAYRITIENQGRAALQLVRRSWVITDGRGRVQRVHGDGVIGQRPVLEPGETFEYTSGVPLETPSGFMAGTYHMMLIGSGEPFDVAIPAFSLDSPHQAGRLH